MLARRLFMALAGALFIVVAANPVAASERSKNAADFVESLGQRAIDSLTVSDIDPIEREARFRTLLLDAFDVKTIGRFVMGRAWRRTDEAQRSEYLTLFEDMLVDTYANRFSEYSGETVSLESHRDIDEKDSLVATKIARPGTVGIDVGWRVRYTDDEYKIIDVIVANVSMGFTQRSEFASIIQRGGGDVEALLTALRNR